MKYLVGIDGSRIADQAFNVLLGMMDRENDMLYMINVYKTKIQGTIEFRYKDHPTDVVVPKTQMFIEHNHLYTTRRVLPDGIVVDSEEVILFLEGKPVNRPGATRRKVEKFEVRELDSPYTGDFYQEDGFDTVFAGKREKVSYGTEEPLYFVETSSHSYMGHGGEKNDLVKYADDLSPANQPGHIKQLYENKCEEAHVRNYEFIVQPKEGNRSTKDILFGVCRELHLDTIVVGSFGTKDERTVLGSTAEFFVNVSTHAVLLVKNTSPVPKPDSTSIKYVIPVSDTPEFKYTIAEKLPKLVRPNDRVTLLRVLRKTGSQNEEELKQFYQDLLAKNNIRGVYITIPPDDDKSAATTMIDFAFERNYDVMVTIPSGKKKFLARNSGSSTLSTILNTCPCTVLALKNIVLH